MRPRLGQRTKPGDSFFLWAAQIRLTGMIPRLKSEASREKREKQWESKIETVAESEREIGRERERGAVRLTEPTTGDKFCILKAKDTKIE